MINRKPAMKTRDTVKSGSAPGLSLALAGALILTTALAPPAALAWGRTGHSIIGALAERLIDGTHAQKQVQALLLPGENLEQLANWLDCAKGTYCGPQTLEMLAFTTANPAHGRYHYTNIPFQHAHYRAGAVGSADDDIVQTLTQAIHVLQRKDGADANLQTNNLQANPHHFTPRQALILVAHLTGDIHQPLHVGAAYVARSGKFAAPAAQADVDNVALFDTRGGNNLLLDAEAVAAVNAGANLAAQRSRQSRSGRPARRAAGPDPEAPAATINFHAYWDMNVVDAAMRADGVDTPRQFARRLYAQRVMVAANSGDPALWPQQWADDGLRVAKLAHAGVAAGHINEQTSRSGEPYALWALAFQPGYQASSRELARRQLASGGQHLAALLQAIWP
jgi:hypothetical protein